VYNLKVLQATTTAIKQADIPSVHGIVSSSLLRHDTLLAITERNGAITFYDCFGMTAITQTQDGSSLRYLMEVRLGFSFYKNGDLLETLFPFVDID